MRRAFDIPTQFPSPTNLDQGLSRDLSRLGNAVQQSVDDPTIARVADTVLAAGGATLALDKVTRLKPPKSGQVVLLLPAATAAMENHYADLVVTEMTDATLVVRPPKGSKVDGLDAVTPYAIGLSRFLFHGGNWYWGR